MVPARTMRLAMTTTPTLSSVQLSAFLSAMWLLVFYLRGGTPRSIPMGVGSPPETPHRRPPLRGARLRIGPSRQELSDVRVGRGLQLVRRALEEHLALAQHEEFGAFQRGHVVHHARDVLVALLEHEG